MNQDPSHTHFGYSSIPISQKSERVKTLFDGIATHYDLMNDLMSFGFHRIWKYITVRYLPLRAAQQIVDVASGSGDIVLQMLRINPHASYTCVDPSAEMLAEARKKLMNHPITYVQSFCEDLEMPESSVDLVTIGFGFRNFTNKTESLSRIYQLLKPGATCAILEFSQSKSQLFNACYQPYARHVIPFIGSLIANDREAYKYLTESIDVHPPAIEMIQLLTDAGFTEIKEHSFMTGLVRCHVGQKPHI